MEYVCTGATLKCTMGTSCPKLKATPKNVSLTGKDQANIADYVSMKNIPSFGRCRSLGYPPTASATAANHGKLTPMPCVPGTCPKWKAIDKDNFICGEPALLRPATLKCMYGGTISIVGPGQTLEIKVRCVSQQSQNEKQENIEQEISEELLQEFNELDKEGLNKNSVLDGVQFVLDAAGMVPVLGAIPDLINASISVLRGDWVGAGLSIVAAVPSVGDVVGGAKIAYKGAKMAKAADSAINLTLVRKAKKYISKDISKEMLLLKGICKSDIEVDIFYKELRAKRRETAYRFYKLHGEIDIDSHINGIDLNKPVRIKKMPPPDKLSRYDNPEREGNRIGSYFGISKTTGNHINVPRNYGIQPIIKTKDGKIIRKRKRVYKLDDTGPQFYYLETTASALPAPLNDDWKSSKTDTANWKNTKGGAMQAYIPNKYKKYLKWTK